MSASNPHLTKWFPVNSTLWFVEFMQQALYHPQYGYYTRPRLPFGAHGDFITAPELSPLFGQTLARFCKEVFSQCERPILFEFGAGSGRLCVDLLLTLESLHSLPEQYLILEVSPFLQQQQHDLLTQQVPHLLERVKWLTSWPEQPFEGVVIANEVLDAMPVHRFKVENDTILESQVVHREPGELEEVWQPCPHERIKHHIETRKAFFHSPYLSECNGLMDDWIKQCAKMLQKGALLLLDYGFPAQEYYHPDRNTGTLMCHYQHRAHANPFIHVGEQDITAHVDFTHVAEAGLTSGFEVAWFANQASFLLDNGLLEQLHQITDPIARFNANQQVNQLISPSEMGELFKVMLLSKSITRPPYWNRRHDKRGSL